MLATFAAALTIPIAAPVVASPAPIACPAIPGADRLWSDRLTWLVLGEGHGTAETPAAFVDLLCLAGETGRPIIVALEMDDSEQSRIDAFMVSDGGGAAVAALTASPDWHDAMQDGRTSRAMLAMIDRLRQLHQAGRIARVVAFRGGTAHDASGDEQNMADRLIAAARPPRTLVVALTGNVHAMLKMVTHGTTYMPMAGRLPAAATITLDVTGHGGSQWACTMAKVQPKPGSAGTGPAMNCSAHVFGPQPARPRGIMLGREAEGRWSGRFDLGVPTTASPPAFPMTAAAPAPS